jgi:hypothetical protein
MPQRSTLLFIACLVPLITAPAASADVQFGGSGLYKGKSPANPQITLTTRDNGTVEARVTYAYRCRGVANYSEVLRATGRVTGATFKATGRSRVRGVGTSKVTVSGTLAPGSASGKVRWSGPGCRSYSNPFVLRSESAPVGAPALPAPGTVAQGLTSQNVGGTRLSVTLRVTNKGRVYATWDGMLQCRGYRLPILDITPSRAIKPDGSFGATQTYTIRYRGYTERYRVSFRGQFLADGVRGTLQASMRPRVKGRARPLCRTGAQTWAARAT